MSLVALLLILAAAVCHATWNLLAKRAGGGAAFVSLFSLLSSLIYAPLGIAVILITTPTLGFEQWIFILGSGALHLGYFLLLQQGYRVGDLSLIYPLARGTGPALSTVAAIIIFSERPSLLAIGGGVLILVGVVMISGGANLLRGNVPRAAVLFGLATGSIIASYTLWDKHAVATLAIPPLVFDWGVNVTRSALLAPVSWKRRAAIRELAQTHWREALGVAILSPLAYILVLTAMTTTPVSYVAPAREISILIGAWFGARLLAEGDTRRRLIAASVMLVGISALALG